MISFNPLLIVYLSAFVFTATLDLWLDKLNADHVKSQGDRVPEPFQGFIDDAELEQSRRYSLENTRFSMIQSTAGKALFLIVVLSGLLPWLAEAVEGWHFLLGGLAFFALPGVAATLISLPFDYYHSFVIEERYGFNTRTLRLWVADLVKSTVLAGTISAVLLSALLITVRYAGGMWWIWAFGAFLGFQLLMTVLYPTVIAPLFNTFTPLTDPGLVEKITRLVEREGLSIRGIYQMDASRRSRHTNAYFTGLGKAKRIVLFDSLVTSHTQDEIVAVLAHELGHFTHHHIQKQLVMLSAASLLLLYGASELIQWEPMFRAFGFSDMPVYAGLFILGVLWEPLGFWVSPAAAALSRRFERFADTYCVRMLKTPRGLINALKKMARDNLSNLTPHPLYVWFTYSHPPLKERIQYLEKMAGAEGSDPT